MYTFALKMTHYPKNQEELKWEKDSPWLLTLG